MRRIIISWEPLGASVTAELDERNSALANLLWNALPYKSLQGHALVAGEHLYHVAPIHGLLYGAADYRLDRREAPDGTVFCSSLQHLGIKYGELTEPMLASPVGQIAAADLPVLAEVGAAVWDAKYRSKKTVIAQVTKEGEPEGHSIPQLPTSNPTVRALIADIYQQTQLDWLEPPAELAALHNGDIASGAGSFGTVLPTLLFVNGETRPLGYATYGGLVRTATNTQMPLEYLVEMARSLIGIPAEFLGYCGLESLWLFTKRVLDVLPEIDTRRDFTALMSHMALYVNCLGGWNLQLFPWDVGDHLRQEVRH